MTLKKKVPCPYLRGRKVLPQVDEFIERFLHFIIVYFHMTEAKKTRPKEKKALKLSEDNLHIVRLIKPFIPLSGPPISANINTLCDLL